MGFTPDTKNTYIYTRDETQWTAITDTYTWRFSWQE